jgi:hypothetical protein
MICLGVIVTFGEKLIKKRTTKRVESKIIKKSVKYLGRRFKRTRFKILQESGDTKI